MDGKALGIIAIALLAVFGAGAAVVNEKSTFPQITGDDVDSNVLALLALLGELESHGDYTALVGGGNFADFSDHPANLGWPGIPTADGKNITTAAGKYQITRRTWNTYKNQFGLTDFSPASQDAFAIGLLRVRGALNLIQQGHFDQAFAKLPDEWESVKFVLAGKYHVTLTQAQQIYADNGGVFA